MVCNSVTWLNANAGAIQAILAAILVAVTIFYAWTTKRLADLTQSQVSATNQAVDEARNQVTITKSMLEATNHAVDEARNQYLNSVQPALFFQGGRQDGSVGSYTHFYLKLLNVGIGPALDLRVTSVNDDLRELYYFKVPPEPFALQASDSVDISLDLKYGDIFTSEYLNENEQEKEKELKELQVSAGEEEITQQEEEIEQKYKKRANDYSEWKKKTDPLLTNGIITMEARYQDIYGRMRTSRVQLRPGMREVLSLGVTEISPFSVNLDKELIQKPGFGPGLQM